MGKLRILDRTGDTTYDYPTVSEAATLVEDQIAAVQEAVRIFAEKQQTTQYLAIATYGDQRKVIKHFDRTADHITMIPRIVGG